MELKGASSLTHLVIHGVKGSLQHKSADRRWGATRVLIYLCHHVASNSRSQGVSPYHNLTKYWLTSKIKGTVSLDLLALFFHESYPAKPLEVHEVYNPYFLLKIRVGISSSTLLLLSLFKMSRERIAQVALYLISDKSNLLPLLFLKSN